MATYLVCETFTDLETISWEGVTYNLGTDAFNDIVNAELVASMDSPDPENEIIVFAGDYTSALNNFQNYEGITLNVTGVKYHDDDAAKATVTLKTFKNNGIATFANAALNAESVVNDTGHSITFKNGAFVKSTFTGAGTVILGAGGLADGSQILGGENDVNVNAASITLGKNTTIDANNLFINKSLTLAGTASLSTTGKVKFAASQYLFVTGVNQINFAEVDGASRVSVSEGGTLVSSVVGSTVYFGKNTYVLGENTIDYLSVKGSSADPEAAAYRKLTVGSADTITTLNAKVIQLGASATSTSGNLDVVNATVVIADTKNGVDAEENPITLPNGQLNIAKDGAANITAGSDVTVDKVYVAAGAAVNVDATSTLSLTDSLSGTGLVNVAGTIGSAEGKTFTNKGKIVVVGAGDVGNVALADGGKIVVGTLDAAANATFSKTVSNTTANNMVQVLNGTAEIKADAIVEDKDVLNGGRYFVVGFINDSVTADQLATLNATATVKGTVNTPRGAWIGAGEDFDETVLDEKFKLFVDGGKFINTHDSFTVRASGAVYVENKGEFTITDAAIRGDITVTGESAMTITVGNIYGETFDDAVISETEEDASATVSITESTLTFGDADYAVSIGHASKATRKGALVLDAATVNGKAFDVKLAGTVSASNGTTIDVTGTINNAGAISIVADGTTLKADAIANAATGSITIDATGYTGGIVKVINLSQDTALKNVTVNTGDTGAKVVYGDDGDVVIHDYTFTDVYVNADWAEDKQVGDAIEIVLGEASTVTAYYGINAFASVQKAYTDGAMNGTTTTVIKSNGTEKTSVDNKEIIVETDGAYTLTGGDGGFVPYFEIDKATATGSKTTLTIDDADIMIQKFGARRNALVTVTDSVIEINSGANDTNAVYYNGTEDLTDTVVWAMQTTVEGVITVSGEDSKYTNTWQTSVWYNGQITVSDGADWESAAFQIGGTNTSTSQTYIDRKNPDIAEDAPATFIVDGAILNAGNNIKSKGGADYSYNTSYGIEVGTFSAAKLDILNDSVATLYTNGSAKDAEKARTIKFGEYATVTVEDSELNIGGKNVDAASFSNAGSLTLSNGATLNATIATTNAGTITVSGSTFNAADTAVTNSGSFTVSGTSTIKVGTLTGNAIEVADGSTIKDSTVGGNLIWEEGTVTFKGENFISRFVDYDKVVIGKGDSLTLTGSRPTLGYGREINVTGDIEGKATETDKTTVTKSFETKNGFSLYGTGTGTLNVTNAYFVSGGSGITLKPKNEEQGEPGSLGTYTLTFTNSIADIKYLKMNETGNDITATVTFDASVLNHDNNITNADPGSTMTFKNGSVANATNSFKNGGVFQVLSGSKFTANGVIQYGENSGNDGAITVDGKDSVMTLVNSSTGHAFKSVEGASITVTNGGVFSANYVTNEGTITIDTASLLTGTALDNTNGTITIDATNLAADSYVKVIDLNQTSALTGVSVLGDARAVYGANGDVVVTNISSETLYVNSAWTGINPDTGKAYEFGDQIVIAEGSTVYYGINAFDTLAGASGAAASGVETNIEVSGDLGGKATFNYGQNVIITGEANFDWGTGWLFIGRGDNGLPKNTDGATVTFYKATIGRTGEIQRNTGLNVGCATNDDTDGKNNGVLNIEGSTINTDYMYDCNLVNISNSTATFGNMRILGREGSESRTGEDVVAVMNITNGSKVNVLKYNGQTHGAEGGGALNITDSEFSLDDTETFKIEAKGLINLNGNATFTANGGINNLGAIKLEVLPKEDEAPTETVTTETEEEVLDESPTFNKFTAKSISNSGTIDAKTGSTITTTGLFTNDNEVVLVGTELTTNGIVNNASFKATDSVIDGGGQAGSPHITNGLGGTMELTNSIITTGAFIINSYGTSISLDNSTLNARIINSKEITAVDSTIISTDLRNEGGKFVVSGDSSLNVKLTNGTIDLENATLTATTVTGEGNLSIAAQYVVTPAVPAQGVEGEEGYVAGSDAVLGDNIVTFNGANTVNAITNVGTLKIQTIPAVEAQGVEGEEGYVAGSDAVAGKLTAGEITNNGTITIDATSTLTATSIAGGTIELTNFADNATRPVITVNGDFTSVVTWTYEGGEYDLDLTETVQYTDDNKFMVNKVTADGKTTISIVKIEAQGTLLVNTDWSSLADGTIVTVDEKQFIIGFNAFATTKKAFTAAQSNNGGTIDILKIEANQLGDTITLTTAGDYLIVGGNTNDKFMSRLSVDGENANVLIGEKATIDPETGKKVYGEGAIVALGKLSAKKTGDVYLYNEFSVNNSIVGVTGDDVDGAAGWMSFHNTSAAIDNSIFGVRLSSVYADVTAPRSASDVKAAVEAGTYAYPKYGASLSGPNVGTVRDLTVTDSTLVTGFFNVRDRGIATVSNSVVYLGGSLAAGCQTGLSRNFSWDTSKSSPSDFNTDGVATITFKGGSIVRNIGYGTSNEYIPGNLSTGLLIGGDKSAGVVNVLEGSQLKMTADESNINENCEDICVFANGTLNAAGKSEISARNLSNAGTIELDDSTLTVEQIATSVKTYTAGDKTLNVPANSGSIDVKNGSTLSVTTAGWTFDSTGSVTVDKSTVSLTGWLRTQGTEATVTITDSDFSGGIYNNAGNEVTFDGSKFCDTGARRAIYNYGKFTADGSTFKASEFRTGHEGRTTITGEDTVITASTVTVMQNESGTSKGKFSITNGTINANAVYNSGTFTVGGEATLNVGALTGTINVVDGAELTATITGAEEADSAVVFDGKTTGITLAADANISAAIVNNGILNATTLTAGAIENNGAFTVTGLTAGKITNNVDGEIVADSISADEIVNSGDINVDAIVKAEGAEVAGAITNNADGEIHAGSIAAATIKNSGDIDADSVSATGTIQNAGTFTVGTIDEALNEEAPLSVTEITETEADEEIAAIFTADRVENSAGKLTVNGKAVIAHNVVVSGGKVTFNGDVTADNMNTQNASATININDAKVTVAGKIYYSGTIVATDSFLDGIEFSGTGTMTVVNSSIDGIKLNHGTMQLDTMSLADVTIDGAFDVVGDSDFSGANEVEGLTVSAGATLTISAAATIAAKDTPSLTVTGDIVNNGTITIDADGLSWGSSWNFLKVVAGAVTNSGTIIVENAKNTMAIVQNDGIYLYKVEGEFTTDTLCVNAAWTGKAVGDKVTYGEKEYVFGMNAFATVGSIVFYADTTNLVIAAGDYDDNLVWAKDGTTLTLADGVELADVDLGAATITGDISADDLTFTGDTTVSGAITANVLNVDETLAMDWSNPIEAVTLNAAPASITIDLSHDLETVGADTAVIATTNVTDFSTIVADYALNADIFKVVDGALMLNAAAIGKVFSTSKEGDGYFTTVADAVSDEATKRILIESVASGTKENIYLNGKRTQVLASAGSNLITTKNTFAAGVDVSLLPATESVTSDCLKVVGTKKVPAAATNLTIDGGKFTGYVLGADMVKLATGEEEVEFHRFSDVNLTINGGTFAPVSAGADRAIAGGLMFAISGSDKTGSARIVGDINLTITGGSFKGYDIYGGNYANNSKFLGSKTSIKGDIVMTLDATENKLVFADNDSYNAGIVTAGSYGPSYVEGNTTVILTGDQGIEFEQLIGGCSGDMHTINEKTGKWDNESYVTGNRTLSFTGFSGDLAFNKIQDFNTVSFEGANEINFDGEFNRYFNDDVKSWYFADAEDTLASLSGSVVFDFSGDTINLEGCASGFELSFDNVKNGAEGIDLSKVVAGLDRSFVIDTEKSAYVLIG